MSCCGQRRSILTASPPIARTRTGANLRVERPHAPAPAMQAGGMVALRSVSIGGVVVRGPATGQQYAFSAATPVQMVEARDAVVWKGQGKRATRCRRAWLSFDFLAPMRRRCSDLRSRDAHPTSQRTLVADAKPAETSVSATATRFIQRGRPKADAELASITRSNALRSCARRGGLHAANKKQPFVQAATGVIWTA